jgi:hypothetical protein
MPDFGYVATCIRTDCEWFAAEFDDAGEMVDVRLFSQLDALREIDRHLFDVHGEKPRTYVPLTAEAVA